MDKHLAGLIGAVGALAAAGPSHAAPAPLSLDDAMRVESYADLLKPIPNAVALRAVLAEQQESAPAVPDVLTVQYYRHHHHHHHYYRRYHHHHHHQFYRRGYYR